MRFVNNFLQNVQLPPMQLPLCYIAIMIEISDIQRRLRETIKTSPLSQKEIAERLHVDPSTITRYMRDDKFPSIDTFANICELLDVSSDEILGLK